MRLTIGARQQGAHGILLVFTRAVGTRCGLQGVREAIDGEAAVIPVEKPEVGKDAVRETAGTSSRTGEVKTALANRLPAMEDAPPID